MKKSPPREYNCNAQLPLYPRRTFILCHLRTTKCRVCRTQNGIANTISCSPRSTGGRRFTPSFAPTSGNTSGDAACTKASASSRRTRCPITYTCLCAYPRSSPSRASWGDRGNLYLTKKGNITFTNFGENYPIHYGEYYLIPNSRDADRFPHRRVRLRPQSRCWLHPFLQRGAAHVLPRLYDSEAIQEESMKANPRPLPPDQCLHLPMVLYTK